MKGRVYDPTIGRFLQADLVVQAPGQILSYNRYGYGWNNPKGYTDPSGYFCGCPADNGDIGASPVDDGTKDSSPNPARAKRDGNSNEGDANLNKEIGQEASGNGVVISPDEQETKGPSILWFNVLMRTGQAVGGAGQVLLGGAICYGSGSLACAGGVLIVAKGLDNVQAGIRGSDSIAQQVLVDVTGSELAGTRINAGLDLVTSVTGLVRSVPKVNSLGNPAHDLFRRDLSNYEAAFAQATTTGLLLEGATSALVIYEAYDASW